MKTDTWLNPRTGLTQTDYVLEDPADITQPIVDTAWEVVTGWFNDSPIDWEDLLDRTESYLRGMAPDGGDYVFAEMDCGAVRKLQRTLRDMKREG